MILSEFESLILVGQEVDLGKKSRVEAGSLLVCPEEGRKQKV